MVAFSKIAIATCAGVVLASPVPGIGPLAVFHHLPKVPSHWVSQGAAVKDTLIRAQIGLKQSNLGHLQAKLLDIADPNSSNYGKWLSREELDAITAPPAENITAVKKWLSSNGITEVSQPTKDWIEFTVPVSKMESLLNTKYETFYNAKDNSAVPRTMKYSVPQSLHSVIDMVTPTTAFYHKISPEVEEDGQANELVDCAAFDLPCDPSAITPPCIQKLYNVDYTSKGSSLVAVTQFLTQQGSHSDYMTFVKQYDGFAVKDFTDVSVGGGKNSGTGTSSTLIEGNLDIQYAFSLGSPNPANFLACSQGSAPSGFTDDFANFASYLTSSSNAPTAVSTSYAGEESEFDPLYMDRICNEFMKAGSLGISVFFSSGDYGVGGEHEASCSRGFYANFPSTCPWSTSVGGTQFNGTQEVVALFSGSKGNGASGGGFSNHFSTPAYQSADTAAYIKTLGSEYSGKYNASGRAYPDISLVAQHFQVTIGGKTSSVHGTSASAPSWAGLVSVFNDYRKSVGKPNLGFINPLLYGSGRSGLRDITAGSNRGCDSDGFPAVSGWDAATGLGSLDFGKFRALI